MVKSSCALKGQRLACSFLSCGNVVFPLWQIRSLGIAARFFFSGDLVQVLPLDRPKQENLHTHPRRKCTQEHQDLASGQSPSPVLSHKMRFSTDQRDGVKRSFLLCYWSTLSSSVLPVSCDSSNHKQDVLPFPITCLVLTLTRSLAVCWNPLWCWCTKGCVPLTAVCMNRSSTHLSSTF